MSCSLSLTTTLKNEFRMICKPGFQYVCDWPFAF